MSRKGGVDLPKKTDIPIEIISKNIICNYAAQEAGDGARGWTSCNLDSEERWGRAEQGGARSGRTAGAST